MRRPSCPDCGSTIKHHIAKFPCTTAPHGWHFVLEDPTGEIERKLTPLIVKHKWGIEELNDVRALLNSILTSTTSGV